MRHSLVTLALGALVLGLLPAHLYGQNNQKNQTPSPNNYNYTPPNVRPPTWYAPPPPVTAYPYYVTPGYTPYGYYGGYGGYVPYSYPGYLPPVFAPSETIYGPGAVQQFFGGENNSSPPARSNPPRRRDRAPDDDPPSSPRSTNAASMAAGQKFIGFGDENFIRQRYADANQRYRKATQAAPALAEGYFRSGFALVALGHYEAAAQMFKRGLNVDPNWPQSQFRLDDLYGANQSVKTTHLESLAKAAMDEPSNGDLLFLVGIELYFDGQKDRAKPFFERADQLAHGNNTHLKNFLASPKPPDVALKAEIGAD